MPLLPIWSMIILIRSNCKYYFYVHKNIKTPQIYPPNGWIYDNMTATSKFDIQINYNHQIIPTSILFSIIDIIMATICQGITNKGQGHACRYKAKAGSNYCGRHQPKTGIVTGSSSMSSAWISKVQEDASAVDDTSVDECCICLEAKVPDNKRTGCGHAVCVECLKQLRKPECPMCRSRLVLSWNQSGDILAKIEANRHREMMEFLNMHTFTAILNGL